MTHNHDEIPYAIFNATGTRQEQTKRYITHTTTNTQPVFGSVLIKGRTRFEGSTNVPWLIPDRLFQTEFAFNYWNISAYLLKKWIYYCEIREITRNNSVNYLEFFSVFHKDCLHFWKCYASTPSPWQVSITGTCWKVSEFIDFDVIEIVIRRHVSRLQSVIFLSLSKFHYQNRWKPDFKNIWKFIIYGLVKVR